MPLAGGRCNDCDATVEWVRTERNNLPMPLDVGEDERGNVVVVDTEDGPRARVFGRGRAVDVDGARRMPHAATCPRDRDRWLRRDRPRRPRHRRNGYR